MTAFLPRRTTSLAAGLVSAALVASLVTAEAAQSAAGPSATAAKCGKKCKKKRATNFLKGHSYTYLSYSGTTGASTQRRIDLCTDKTLVYRADYVGGSGYAYADGYSGTWRVASATKSGAKVDVTTAGYWTSDPYWQYAPPPPTATSTVQALSGTVVYIDGVEFSRGDGSC